jgi:hypothetical protein
LFSCDERVFNRNDYPDFYDWIHLQEIKPETKPFIDRNNITPKISNTECNELFPTYYKEWVRMIGGVKNVFLRELIKDKKKHNMIGKTKLIAIVCNNT